MPEITIKYMGKRLRVRGTMDHAHRVVKGLRLYHEHRVSSTVAATVAGVSANTILRAARSAGVGRCRSEGQRAHKARTRTNA